MNSTATTDAERAIVAALTQAMIVREPLSPNRLERVAQYIGLLAQAAGIRAAERVERLTMAAKLYDVGKIGIPDRILLKAGPLTPTELAVMKTHTTVGADMLRALTRQGPDSELLAIAIGMAQDHHERFGGGGYPRGVAGDQIDSAARLIAVADVYDALASKRCYKAPFSHEQSRQIILEQSGAQFDPVAAAAFAKVEAGFAEIAQRLADPE